MSKKAKRVVGVLLSLTLMLAMSVSVFAADPSPSAKPEGGTGNVTSGVDSEGNEIKFAPIDRDTWFDKANTAYKNGAIANMPAGTWEEMDTINVVGPDGYVKGTKITITFAVSGVKVGDTVGALHYNEATDSWEYLAGTVTKDGFVTITFPNGLSPVVIVKGKVAATDSKTIGSGTTTTTKSGASPKTGEFATTSVLAVLAVLAMGGAAVCYRKREEVR